MCVFQTCAAHMAQSFKRLFCVHRTPGLFIIVPVPLGHHCRPRAEYKFFMFFLPGSYGHTWFSTAFIDFKQIGRRDLVKYCDTVRANEQVIHFSTLYIKSQYVPLFVIKLLPNPLPVHIQMMTSLNGSIFRFAGPLRGESTGHRLIFSMICAWTNGWRNTRDASDLRRVAAHCGVNVMNRTESNDLKYVVH